MTAKQVQEENAFASMDQDADLCVFLVNYNTAHLLPRCLGELRRASMGVRVRVVIVDNASRDGSAELIRSNFPDCTLIANEANVGFGRANNQALQFSDAPFVLLLNADAYVYPDAVHKSLSYMRSHPRCGVLGARLVDEAGVTLWSHGRQFPDTWEDFLTQAGLRRRRAGPIEFETERSEGSSAVACDWVVGCYYMVRREVIRQIGLFDPRYFLYFEEVDHCRAVHAAGWRVESLTSAWVTHVGGGSAETEGELSSSGRQISALQIESELLYCRKHNGFAGVAASITLALVADAIRSLKWILRGRSFAGMSAFWSHATTICRLAVLTRLGTRPTR